MERAGIGLVLLCFCVGVPRALGQNSDCQPGWYGNSCNTPCPLYNCYRCQRWTGTCTECKVGFYGTNCDLACDSHCQGRCDRTTSFCTSCPSGFYGPQHCYQLCSTRCADSTCDRNTGKCSGCQAGWYGDKCNTPCLANNCLNNECNQQTGLCTACADNFAGDYCTACKEGFHGNKCDQNCDWHCQGGCDKTTSYCTSCKVGYYGQYRCQQSCSTSCDSTCQRVNGYCDACKPGYHGNKCQFACSSLSPGCAQCTQKGQTCTRCKAGFASPWCTACQDGYYKQAAQCLRCSNNCAANTNCNKDTGKCDGCKYGYYGDQCQRACSVLSQRCTQCSQDGQTCTKCWNGFAAPSCTECQDGYYKQGTQCVRCRSNCAPNTSCNKDTGKCDGCVDGRYGDMCYRYCTPSGRCLRCDQDTGVCLACSPSSSNLAPPSCIECLDGFYDQYSYPTSCTNCTWQCYNDTACDKRTGYCDRCPPGKSGNRCGQLCSSGSYGQDCSESCGHCQNNSACDVVSGACNGCDAGFQPPLCKTGCENGTYGVDCDQTCGHCKDGTACDKVDGQCALCDPGWLQPMCKTQCPPGYYGDGCNKTCGNCLEKSMCRHDTGQCQSGCAEGFTGNLCVQAQVQDGPAGDVATVAGGTVAGILVIVAIVAVVIIFVMRRRRRGNKSGGHSDVPAEMWNSREGLNDRQESPATTSPLSFSPEASDEAKAKPTVQVKPTVLSSGKPAVQSKPTQSAKSNGAIYENISILQQKPKPEPTLSTSPGKPDSNKTKTSPKLNGVQVKAATNSKGKPLKPSKPGDGKESRSGVETPPEPVILSGARDAVYANEQTYSNIAPTNIRLDMLQKTVVDKLRDGKLAEEFSQLVPNKDYPVTNGQRDENYYKNRFNSILPYNKNRVELEKVDGDDASDYVNASFVKGHKSEKAYIAAQGPKMNTQDDFWRMVWQERVTDIVILTNTMEGSKGKCYKYWPSEGATLNTGNMEVTGVEEEGRAHFVIRTFDVRQLKGKEKVRVKQYHYVSWMDHEVPATTPLINFWRYVRAHAPRSASATPLLVHCSAGVGRTGTYIALDIIMDHAEQQNAEINIYNIVDKLREDRCHMVQNKGQYEFLHEAVLEAYNSRDTRMETAAFDSAFPDTIRHDAPHQRIDAEFQTLMKMRNCLTHRTYTTATQKENRAKNRNPKALPDDKHLAFLTQHVRGRNQFINAVFMPTFEEPRGSILTQLPLPDTLMDLWRLVDGCGSDTIVSIGEVDGGKDMCRYWPKDKETIKTGSYTISLDSMAKIGECLFSYSVTMQRDDKSRAVRVLHYAGWTGEVADNASDLIHLLTTLQSSHKKRDGKPVIVQCIDGVARSGVVCALWEVISRLTCDGEVDIYLAVRQVHSVRPEAIASEEQYRYCYEMIQQFRNSQSVYANT